MQQKVALGLSGGVDSSVAAALLLAQGYDVTGIYLECYNEPGCRTDQDKADALKVAIKLGIPFKVLDFRTEYKEKVIEYFYAEYEAGRTPNPDVMCNREVKFGIFYDWALRLNSFAQGYKHEPFDFVATGHYARITPDFKLQQAKDKTKDQSYFLWQVPRDNLKHVLFPLGNMLKSEVRQKAKELKLITANKPDSMGICFIGEVDTAELLRKKLGENPGQVIYNDQTVGRHRGLWFYTIGERKGFELDKTKLKKMGLHPEKMAPFYVIAKNKDKNELIVGSKDEVMTDEIRIEKVEFRETKRRLFARIRNLGELYEVMSFDGETIKLREKIFAVAEGQSVVLYDESAILVQGGVIV